MKTLLVIYAIVITVAFMGVLITGHPKHIRKWIRLSDGTYTATMPLSIAGSDCKLTFGSASVEITDFKPEPTPMETRFEIMDKINIQLHKTLDLPEKGLILMGFDIYVPRSEVAWLLTHKDFNANFMEAKK